MLTNGSTLGAPPGIGPGAGRAGAAGKGREGTVKPNPTEVTQACYKTGEGRQTPHRGHINRGNPHMIHKKTMKKKKITTPNSGNTKVTEEYNKIRSHSTLT